MRKPCARVWQNIAPRPSRSSRSTAARGLLARVDGMGEIDAVTKAIEAILDAV